MSYTEKSHSAAYPSIAPTNPALSMAGKTVLITGGGSGIGRAAAGAFATAGAASIVLIGRRAAPLAAVAAELRAAHPHLSTPSSSVLTFSVDILDAVGLGRAVEVAVASSGGKIDVVVHCAASLGPIAPLVASATTDVSEAAWSCFEVNVRGTLALAQAVLPHLQRKGGSTTTSTSSSTGSTNSSKGEAVFVALTSGAVVFPPIPGLAAYAAAKAGMMKLLQCLSAEAEAASGGFRVVHVHPGIQRTEGGMLLEEKGIVFPYDDSSLAPAFLVWAASEEAAFLKDKFVFANWDVDELKARKDEIQNSPELTIGLRGFPRSV